MSVRGSIAVRCRFVVAFSLVVMSPDLVSHYQATRGRVGDRVAALDGRSADRIVPACPAWSVRDAVAHVTGIAVDLAAGRMPGADTQRWIDGHVADRRDRAVADIVDEWVTSGVEAFIARSGSGQLLLDVCMHEHDICHAIGVTGDRDSDQVHACVPVMVELLRKDLAARGAPGAVQLTARGTTWVAGDGPVALMLEAEPFELLRIFGGRRSEAQMRSLPWTRPDGAPADVGPWLAFVGHFAYPVADLVE
jgi:uncharacterized protein (TIGR03083 family)